MKKIKNITFILFGLLSINLFYAQKIVEDVPRALAPDFTCQKNDFVGELNGKKIERVQKYYCGDHYVGIFQQVGSKAGNTNCLYTQDFDKEFKPIGELKVLFDLKANGYSDESIKVASIPAAYNLISSPDNKFSLFSFVIQPFETGWEKESKGDNLAFVCVLDSESKVLSQYIYKSTLPSSKLTVELLSQGNNGEGMFSVLELRSGIGVDGNKQIVKAQDVILNKNGQVYTLDPIKPHFEMVGALKASINDQGNLLYSISNSELNGNLVSITIRDFDLNKGELQGEYTIDIPLDYRYKIAHISRLEDGSKLVVFELGRAFMEWGLLICKFDNYGELTWKKSLPKVKYGGAFYDKNNSLSLLVDYDKKVFDGGELPRNNQAWGSENDKYVPVIITIGTSKGILDMKKLTIPGFTEIVFADDLWDGFTNGYTNGLFWFEDKKGEKGYKLVDLNAE